MPTGDPIYPCGHILYPNGVGEFSDKCPTCHPPEQKQFNPASHYRCGHAILHVYNVASGKNETEEDCSRCKSKSPGMLFELQELAKEFGTTVHSIHDEIIFGDVPADRGEEFLKRVSEIQFRHVNKFLKNSLAGFIGKSISQNVTEEMGKEIVEAFKRGFVETWNTWDKDPASIPIFAAAADEKTEPSLLGAITGRMSCNEPNLSSEPRPTYGMSPIMSIAKEMLHKQKLLEAACMLPAGASTDRWLLEDYQQRQRADTGAKELLEKNPEASYLWSEALRYLTWAAEEAEKAKPPEPTYYWDPEGVWDPE